MANHWAIVVGINQYQSFPPLLYAQRDAQSLHDFLIDQAGFSAQRCWLLTESAEPIEQMPAYPTGETIRACLNRLCQEMLQPGDVLWCFFGGYGVSVEGRDYLMPIDGDPTQIETTGLAIDSLFAQFQAAATDNIVLLLDINRSQGAVNSEGVGRQTAELAQAHKIPTIMSCLPEQFAHETLALRQGLFMAALLEGLRQQGCITLEQLERWLGDRLPELSEYHWRPRQEPLAIIPAEKKYLLIVPESAAATLGMAVNLSSAARLQSYAVQQGGTAAGTAAGTAVLERTPQAGSAAFTGGETMSSAAAPSLDQSADRPDKIPPSAPVAGATAPAPANPESEVPEVMDARLWRSLLVWGSVLAVLLLLGVLVRTGKIFTQHPAPSPAKGAPSNPSPADTSPQSSDDAAKSPLEIADFAIKSQQYDFAKQQLEQVPPNDQSAEYNRLLEQAHRGLLSQARAFLSRSRPPSAENQASDFVEAIKSARRIRKDQPLYDEAQADIERWSRVILDMAQGRAERGNNGSTPTAAGNYNSAIATALLVPTDQAEVYNQAQQAIALWSQKILDLANDRAGDDNLNLAIQTAQLVPPNTPAYGAAQEAIAKWQNQINGSPNSSSPSP